MSIQLNKLTGLVLLCLAFFSSALVAQDFSAQNSKYSPAIYGDKFTYEEDKFYYFDELEGVLFLKGSIEQGMYKDFRQAISDNKIHTLVLESPGGIVLEGVLIAETVFDRKIKTYIRKNQNCASACAFIFLSGETRYSLGELGVHQIGYSDEYSKTRDEVGKTAKAIQTVNSRIIQVLEENDTPGFVYKYMLRGEEMYYFNEDELNQLGNSYVSPQDKLLFNRIDNFSKDYNSHLIKRKCDTDPNTCTTAQLCSRAAKDSMWRTSLDASKFVKLAKSKGNRCGVPVPICPEDIKKCNEEYLCTYATTSMDTGLSWLNNSFADEAKLRGYNCGVKKQITNRTCSKDIKICTDSQLCKSAVEFGSNPKKWTTDQKFKKYIIEAKSRQLLCGIKKQLVKKTCIQDAKFCNNLMLCQKATDTTMAQGMGWSKLSAFASYVTEAKRRRLSCATYSLSFKEKKCAENLKKCSNFDLCKAATYKTGNKILWKTHPAYPQFIYEAQRRLLNCNTKTKPIINQKVEYVKSIQLQLNKLGCNAGTADGILGRKTFSALQRWKSAGVYSMNINDISEQPSKILAVLEITSLKCEKTKRFPSVAGTWKISYNNCNKNIKNPYLHLSVISSKKLYESFLHTDYQRLHLTGKLNIQDRNFKLKLNGKTGRLLTKSEEMLVTGTFNEALNIIDGMDQNGCIFKGTKLDQNTYFDGTGITRKK
ncbi:hypothetical protein OAC62_01780 [Amylibacter sp.]|nr:hypothetical protein [Amylibacter sp.]